jgi:hypothetical protein
MSRMATPDEPTLRLLTQGFQTWLLSTGKPRKAEVCRLAARAPWRRRSAAGRTVFVSALAVSQTHIPMGADFPALSGSRVIHTVGISGSRVHAAQSLVM